MSRRQTFRIALWPARQRPPSCWAAPCSYGDTKLTGYALTHISGPGCGGFPYHRLYVPFPALEHGARLDWHHHDRCQRPGGQLGEPGHGGGGPDGHRHRLGHILAVSLG